MSSPPSLTIVVPSVGRPALGRLLASLAAQEPPGRRQVVVVDDRRAPSGALAVPGWVTALRGAGRGPAAARNVGWRAAGGEWVAFVDDDVVCPPGWMAQLERDLAVLPPEVAASQGRIEVPLPDGRRPTDWERNVAGLADARWATADMAYRRAVLDEVGGFDERFPRAFREDADLALRVLHAGYLLVGGRRRVVHPVGPAGPAVSLRRQAGNADDVLMRALHGRHWRERAGAEGGRNGRHLLTTAAATGALAAGLTGRRRSALVLGGLWAAGTAELLRARLAPGPRTIGELATMAATSLVLPEVAVAHAVAGLARLPRLLTDSGRAPLGRSGPAVTTSRPARPARPAYRERPAGPPVAVLFDRDGTLVVDRPYNGDPERVVPMPGARVALDRLRRDGVRLGVVTNQSGVARGLLSRDQVDAVNARVDELLGPFDSWAVCPHGPEDGCACRKPAPGLVQRGAAELGCDPSSCVVIGDIGADVEAALRAGARAVLVPTPATARREVASAPALAWSLPDAADLVLAGCC